jgi:hypothetical protein
VTGTGDEPAGTPVTPPARVAVTTTETVPAARSAAASVYDANVAPAIGLMARSHW